MHELDVLTKTIQMVDRIAEQNEIGEVKFIALEIGELTQYLPEFLGKYFPMVTAEIPRLKNTSLNIKVIEGLAVCEECRTQYNVMTHEGVCPECDSRRKTVLSGKEFKIKEIWY